MWCVLLALLTWFWLWYNQLPHVPDWKLVKIGFLLGKKKSFSVKFWEFSFGTLLPLSRAEWHSPPVHPQGHWLLVVRFSSQPVSHPYSPGQTVSHSYSPPPLFFCTLGCWDVPRKGKTSSWRVNTDHQCECVGNLVIEWLWVIGTDDTV